MQASISAAVKIMTSSGFILMPWVSSPKKRSRPALAAGIGPLFSRFFCLLLLLNSDISKVLKLYTEVFSN